MAIRQLRYDEDPMLRKKCRDIKEADERIMTLAEDMIETMYNKEGVGLAGPQVGVLRNIIVVDIGEGPIIAVNPKIVSESGADIDNEGCLSLPDTYGAVERPEKIVIKYIDIENNEKTMEAEGLMARVFCHEIDHLDGILYTDKVIEGYEVEENDEEYEYKDEVGV